MARERNQLRTHLKIRDVQQRDFGCRTYLLSTRQGFSTLEFVNLWIVIGASTLGALMPGPATLAIAGTSLKHGRVRGLAMAWGVATGSMIWATAAGLGIGAGLAANHWLFEFVRYLGVTYLLWLGWGLAQSALTSRMLKPRDVGATSLGLAWSKGALIHLTNPKALIFWGSILAIGLKPGAPPLAVFEVLMICITIDVILVSGYAILFSNASLTRGYLKLRRIFESLFALFFAGAAIELLII